MAYTTIDDPSAYFQAKLHTGTGSEHAVSGIGFAPNWVWIKSRSDAHDHFIHDTVRGATKRLNSLNTDAEATVAEGLKSFDSDGFTMGTNGNINEDDETFVSWNWKETADAGFDIVSYTGSGSAKTVAHNLGVKPDVIICKSRSGVEEWRPYFSALGATYAMRLNGTNTKDDDAGYWNDVEPTSSVFTVGTNAGTNGSSVTFIAYCFSAKQGYSKFGSYKGNDNANGTFVYLGFSPAWIMIKRTDSVNDWIILDNKRNPINPSNERILANTNAAASTANTMVDFLSNGFKPRSTYGGINSANNFIYMAFAEQPFVTSTGVPATAR